MFYLILQLLDKKDLKFELNDKFISKINKTLDVDINKNNYFTGVDYHLEC